MSITAAEAVQRMREYLDNGSLNPIDVRTKCRYIAKQVDEVEADVGSRVEKSGFGYDVRVDGRPLGLDVSYDTAHILLKIIESGRNSRLVHGETIPMRESDGDTNYKFKFEVGSGV
jgi:hypothetical protein